MIHLQIFILILMTSAINASKRKMKQEAMENEASKANYSNQALVSVKIKNLSDFKYLKQLATEKIDFWDETLSVNSSLLMRVYRNQLKNLKKALKRKDIKYRVVANDLQRLVLEEANSYGNSWENDLTNLKDYNFNTHNSFKNIENFLKMLTRDHKDISRMNIIGYTFEKRPLYAVNISSKPRWLKGSNTTQKIILIDCGFHGREWASVTFCVYFINQLITGYKEGEKDITKVLTKYDFIIIPVINPDGYVYSHTLNRFWRKNRSKNKKQKCPGVDLNRNFDVSFGGSCRRETCAESYCGKKPFSELETASLKRLLKRNKGQIKAYFTMHSFGQLWVFPWAKRSENKPKNYDEMERVGQIGAKELRKKYGTEYTVGMISNVLYECNGTSVDYVYDKGFAEYAFALELRDKGTYGFMLPKKIMPSLNEETKDGILAAVLAMK